MAKITKRTNKDEIYEAYQAAIARIQELESNTFNPEKEVETKKNEEVLKSASETIEMNILNPEIINKYKNVLAAIELKEAELKELYGIEKEANTFAALLEARKNELDEYDTKITNKKAEYVDLYTNLAAEHQEKIKKLNDEACEYKKQLQKDRDREDEEYNYNLERQRKLDNDKWEDEKAARLKEVEAKEEAIAQRELALQDMTNEIAELNAKLEEVPAAIAAAKEEAIAETKSKLEKSHHFEKAAMQKDYDHLKETLQSKIDTLEEKVSELNATNNDLRENLNASYERIQTIANESVKNSGVRILESGSNNK